MTIFGILLYGMEYNLVFDDDGFSTLESLSGGREAPLAVLAHTFFSCSSSCLSVLQRLYL